MKHPPACPPDDSVLKKSNQAEFFLTIPFREGTDGTYHTQRSKYLIIQNFAP